MAGDPGNSIPEVACSRTSIVPLAAASLEWILRPNLHNEGEVIAVMCTGLRIYL